MKCPECNKRLVELDDKFKCERCGREFTKDDLDRIREADFLTEHSYFKNLMEDSSSF